MLSYWESEAFACGYDCLYKLSPAELLRAISCMLPGSRTFRPEGPQSSLGGFSDVACERGWRGVWASLSRVCNFRRLPKLMSARYGSCALVSAWDPILSFGILEHTLAKRLHMTIVWLAESARGTCDMFWYGELAAF